VGTLPVALVDAQDLNRDCCDGNHLLTSFRFVKRAKMAQNRNCRLAGLSVLAASLVYGWRGLNLPSTTIVAVRCAKPADTSKRASARALGLHGIECASTVVETIGPVHIRRVPTSER
jgi:hypothetical protein